MRIENPDKRSFYEIECAREQCCNVIVKSLLQFAFVVGFVIYCCKAKIVVFLYHIPCQLCQLWCQVLRNFLLYQFTIEVLKSR